jgi:hypothetical protein
VDGTRLWGWYVSRVSRVGDALRGDDTIADRNCPLQIQYPSVIGVTL